MRFIEYMRPTAAPQKNRELNPLLFDILYILNIFSRTVRYLELKSVILSS